MISPDLIILNGAVHTLDPAQGVAEALAILGERIVALGTSKEIRALAGAKTRIVDAGQGTVLPGFNDAHVHFLAGGFSLSNVDLRPATSREDLARHLAEYIQYVPKGTWIQGGDWDHEKWLDAPGSAAAAAASVAAVSLEDLKLKIIKQATPLLPFNYSQFNNCFVPAEFAFCDADLWNWRVRIVVISYSACRWIIELMCLLLGKKPRNLVFSRLLGFAAWIFYMLLLALLCGILVS